MRIKIYSLIMCIIYIVVAVIPVSATTTVSTDIFDDSIVVKGTLETERGNTPLLLLMKDENGENILAEFTQSIFNDGEVTFSFPKIFLPLTLESKDYIIEISGQDIEETITLNYEYFGPDKILGILKSVESSETPGNTVVLKSKILGIKTDDYDDLSEKGNRLFETSMKSVVYDLPENVLIDENRQKVKEETKKLKEAFDKSICIGLFYSIDTTSDLVNWLDRFYKELGFDTDNSDTEYDENKITEYLNNVKKGKAFLELVKKAPESIKVNEIGNYLYESAFLSVIKEKSSSEIKTMLLGFPKFFNVDLDALNSLSVSKQALCFSEIKGKSYDTCIEAGNALNEEIEKQASSSGSGGGGTGGSSGSSDRGGGSVSVKGNTQEEKAEVVENAEFTDIESVLWAKDAIEFLTKRNILNGRSESIFAPNDNITRAEFVKMIVVAMGIKTDAAESPFTDVSEGTWYCAYTSAAYKEGIVQGDALGNFNPNKNITRQDMAVMLYRALKANSTETSLDFSDAIDIDDYAKKAVSYFAQKKIINGMGDGRFAPKNLSTRAQAAVMLLNIINSNDI